MSCPPSPGFAFTQLIESPSNASATPPQGFDSTIAFLLGQCCNLTYTQFAAGTAQLSAEQITAAIGPDFNCTQVGNGITVSEELTAGSEIGQPGAYATVAAGFALNCTPAGGGQSINVIALRGTQTLSEWVEDAEGIPTAFHVGNRNGKYYLRSELAPLGMVHGGFYALYNQGTDGAQPQEVVHDLAWAEYTRPTGSIAEQIATLVGQLDNSLPLYVTGHSLGAALAVICAMDIGTNFPKSFAAGQLQMYNLACPLVAAGIKAFGIGVGASYFVEEYNKAVPVSFRIVHSADIVPILPPVCTSLGSELMLEFAHVTDNAVNFIAQTGSIGGNHACADTYVHYLKKLAQGF
ncbi:MAG TPA: lipase family protein [Blastocatellia bacterium]|nr:lipase family protein [Blastocatellia bacterium]